MRALVVALGLIATPVAAADQFDLICKGKKEWSGRRPVVATILPVSLRLRIDTAAKQFCYDLCESTYPIETVGVEGLLLGNYGAKDLGSIEYLDFRTSDYLFVDNWFDDGGMVSLQINARCTRASFSGFPKARIKIERAVQ